MSKQLANQPITTWRSKFAVAIHGCHWALRTQTSFRVHLPVGAAVLGLCGFLSVEPWRWTIVIIAIGMVVTAELINSSIEQLVRALHPQHDARVGLALDMAAGAVLVTAGTSVAVGLVTLAEPLMSFAFAL